MSCMHDTISCARTFPTIYGGCSGTLSPEQENPDNACTSQPGSGNLNTSPSVLSGSDLGIVTRGTADSEHPRSIQQQLESVSVLAFTPQQDSKEAHHVEPQV